MRTGLLQWWYGITPAVRGLLGFFLVSSVLIPGLQRTLCSEPYRGTALSYTHHFLRQRSSCLDSWEPMAFAVRSFHHHPAQPLYQRIFFHEKIKFQYPLTSLLPVALILQPALNSWLQTHGWQWFDVLQMLSWVLVFVTAIAVAGIYRLESDRGEPTAPSVPGGLNGWLITGLGVALTLTYLPVIQGYCLGQIQVWINALFALLLWSWLCGREKQAGALAGLMCLIKPQYGVLVLWGLLRRRWGFVTVALAVGGTGLAFALVGYGYANNLDYLHVLSFIGRRGEAYFPNQSVNGLLHRLLNTGDNLTFDKHAFPPFDRLVYLGTLSTSVLLLGLALLGPWCRGKGFRLFSLEKDLATDLALAALACTLASPVAWIHHLGILLPIYAFLLPRLCRRPVLGRWTVPLLALSYLLTASYLSFLNQLAHTRWNFLQSHVLAGALLALVLLFRLRHQEAAECGSRVSWPDNQMG